MSDTLIPEERIERIKIAVNYEHFTSRLREIVAAAYEDLREHPEPVTDEQAKAAILNKWPTFSSCERLLKDMMIGFNVGVEWSQCNLLRAPDPDAPIKDLLLDEVRNEDTCRAHTSNLRVREAFKRGKESK